MCTWDEPIVRNIVFVHGLGGHAYNTWQAAPDSFWPSWLGEDIPGSAVFTLSYDAPVTNWLGTTMAIQDRSRNVLELLRLGLKGTAKISFVCHSLGGLIIKQVMLDLMSESATDNASRSLYDRVDQIVFLATPHTGARHASLLDRLSLLAWPSAVAKNLVANDSALRKINVDYRALARRRGDTLNHLVLFETHGTAAGTIVDPGAADPGLVSPPIPVDADHLSISKPRARSSYVYSQVKEFLSKDNSERRRLEYFHISRPVLIEKSSVMEFHS